MALRTTVASSRVAKTKQEKKVYALGFFLFCHDIFDCVQRYSSSLATSVERESKVL